MANYAVWARQLDVDAGARAALSGYVASLHRDGVLVGHGGSLSQEAFVITSDRRAR